jgi:hypothetical protein
MHSSGVSNGSVVAQPNSSRLEMIAVQFSAATRSPIDGDLACAADYCI